MQVSNFDTIAGRVAADTANAATFNLALPPGKTGGLYTGEHKLGLGADTYSVYDGKWLVAFGTPGFATITNQFGRTIPAGTQVYLTLERPGISGDVEQNPGIERVRLVQSALIDIGNPAATLANGLATSQTVTFPANVVLVKNTLDVPRNVIGAWTTSRVCTVRGKDEYGAALTESSASAAAFTGKKAFASIDSISFNGNVTAATFGWGNVLGLPFYIDKVTDVIRVTTLTANETTTQLAGVVVGDRANPTATTGDVRGTYVPQAPIAVNGTITYCVQVNAFDLYNRGRVQYAG